MCNGGERVRETMAMTERGGRSAELGESDLRTTAADASDGQRCKCSTGAYRGIAADETEKQEGKTHD
ncbi:hypothetical protein Scep_025424 [Stephania cephalantha]|uniref:Uncharacterized protein n=1 Tax=Stephania cephalantha TaxID=152367 RepID=A0AAP0EI78_9MAGN